MTEAKTHYRKVFDSPYLSAADVVEPIILTIRHVVVESDKTKKTKDLMNTAYFIEKEIRKGEPLKPMILNATNSKMMAKITGSPFIEDWTGSAIEVYVDGNVRFGRETVEGLRIRPVAQKPQRQELTPLDTDKWKRAITRLLKDGNLDAVEAHVFISDENKALLHQQAKEEQNAVAQHTTE